ncbi:MAG: hypothetical protein U0R50_00340 [Gaiellales bacterium]
MSIVKALLMGTVASAIVGYVFAAAVALAVAAQGGELHLAFGPLVLLGVEHQEDGTAVALGPGLLVVAVAGGVVNGAAGLALRRRA